MGAGAENASEPGNGMREKLNRLKMSESAICEIVAVRVMSPYCLYCSMQNGPALLESGATSPLVS